MSIWSSAEGVDLCRKLEIIAPAYGAHVALTGGLLYKDGLRKDCDLLLYRIRQAPFIDWLGFFKHARMIGLELAQDYGWCKKCDYLGKPVDIFDSEADGLYGSPEENGEVT